MDLHWTWNHCTDELWRRLDPKLWALSYHPSTVLQGVSRDRLAEALAEPDFCRLLDNLISARCKAAATPVWFQLKHPETSLSCVVYFCMEFMLSEALPVYSGGLGNVAGDQLKSASDLGIPVIGVGLLYQHGYFRQVIDRNGAQQALYPSNDPGQLPVHLCFGRTASRCGWRLCCPAMPSGFGLGRCGLADEALPARHERCRQRPRSSRNHQRDLYGGDPDCG